MKIDLRFAFVAILLVLAGPSTASAAELKVLVAGAYDQVFQALLPDFERQTGNTVKSEKGPAGTLKKRVESGEAFDIAIITPAVMEGLIKDGKLDGQSFAKVAAVGVGVGVKDGAPKPDIRRSTRSNARCSPPRPLPIPIRRPARAAACTWTVCLVRLGIADQVRPKAKLKAGGHAGDFVASGDADIVVQQASEIIPVKGWSCWSGRCRQRFKRRRPMPPPSRRKASRRRRRKRSSRR